MHFIWITLVSIGMTSVTYAADLVQVEQQLLSEMDGLLATQARSDVRIAVVHDFVKNLQKLDDKDLGDVTLFLGDRGAEKRVQAQALLQEIQSQLMTSLETYEQTVKPILLNNIKLKRDDFAKEQNRGELIQLFFSSVQNHRTGKPVTGIWAYQQDVSDSIFSTKLVDAGLKVNFPRLIEAEWMKKALDMEAELLVLREMHRGVSIAQMQAEKSKQADKPRVASKVSKTASRKTAHVKSFLLDVSASALSSIEQKLLSRPKSISLAYLEKDLPSEQRLLTVQKFAQAIKQLDAEEDKESFRAALVDLVERYETSIQFILLDNISLVRADIGAKANKGDLINLFYANRSNHNTGKPILGKLRYEKDVSSSLFSTEMAEVGLLVDKPDLANAPYIQNALNMEAELAVLLQKHQEYQKDL